MKCSARFVLPFAAMLMLASCGDGPDALLAKAREDLAAGNAQEARYRLAAALREKPGDDQILLLLAQAHLQQGDADGAERALARLGKESGSVQAIRIRAQIALQRGDAAAALRLIGQDNSAEGWGLRAQAHLARGEKAEAATAFENALKTGGDMKVAAAYARYLLGENDLDRTARVLHQMQAQAPDAYETLVLAGDLAVARGDDAAAIAAFRKAVDAYPDRAAPMLALADHYVGKDRMKEAEALLDKAEEIEPDNAIVATMRLKVMARQDRWKDIRNMLQTRESQLQPGSETALIYARALLNLGQAGQARLLAGRAVLMQPDNQDALILLGEARLATGDAQGAWETLRPMAKAAMASPDVLKLALRAARQVEAPEMASLTARTQPAQLAHTQALVDKGEAALAAEDWSAALGTYRGLLGTGEDPEVLTRLAFVSTRMGQTSAAIAYADRALAARDTAQYLYFAAMARLEGNVELPRAVSLLKRAVAADPDNAEIAQALHKAKAAAG